MHTSFSDSDTLGKFIVDLVPLVDVRGEELKAAHERIDELKASLAEMVEIYWGEGDGHDAPPACIQRAQAALNEEAR